MKVIGKDILSQFVRKHSDVKNWIGCWLADVEETKWITPNDVKRRYSTASFLEKRVVIFNVKGNSYRLEVRISYQSSVVDVLWAGTHAEYDKRNSKR